MYQKKNCSPECLLHGPIKKSIWHLSYKWRGYSPPIIYGGPAIWLWSNQIHQRKDKDNPLLIYVHHLNWITINLQPASQNHSIFLSCNYTQTQTQQTHTHTQHTDPTFFLNLVIKLLSGWLIRRLIYILTNSRGIGAYHQN